MPFFFFFFFGALDLLWVRREAGYRNVSFLGSSAQVTSLTPFVLNTIFCHYLDEMFFLFRSLSQIIDQNNGCKTDRLHHIAVSSKFYI